MKKSEVTNTGQNETDQDQTTSQKVVYCGPSIKGIATQYTVFAGGIPETMGRLMEKYPTMKSLMVPIDKFAETRKKLNTKESAQALIYAQIETQIREG